MRIGFTGSGPLAILTARELLEDGHEVIIIESDKERIEELAEDLDCGFLHGDGSRPKVLKELSPENTDYLFCINEHDENAIITALVGRSLGFEHVITVIEEPDFLTICSELGLEDVQVPDYEVSKRLASMVEGRRSEDFSALADGGLMLFEFAVDDRAGSRIGDLDLPQQASVIAVRRGDKTRLAEPDMELSRDEHVVILVHRDSLDQLEEKFAGGDRS